MDSKVSLKQRPPDFFLPVTESLHQWQQNPAYGALFGDLAPYRPPRAILADEIHLYTTSTAPRSDMPCAARWRGRPSMRLENLAPWPSA